jgi:NADH-quinone oxidoreductase subunit H
MFLGGWMIPFTSWNAIPEIVFLLKVFLVFFVFAWVRAAHARVRTDQILWLGWKVLLPLAVINLGITVALMLGGVV